MKKILKLVAILFSTFLIVGCSKPKITKEQQDNVAIRIYRNYDIQEIEFLSFRKNKSTGSYILKLKINGEESTLIITDLKELEYNDLEIGLSPVGDFKDLERASELTGSISISNIKVIYIGEK